LVEAICTTSITAQESAIDAAEYDDDDDDDDDEQMYFNVA